MAEQLVNEFTVNRPIDEAWAVITDVERIAPCLPGAELQEIEGDVYRGVVKVKLGSITPQFKGQATFIDRDDPAHRAVLKAEGRDTGGRGNAAAEITAQAESLSPTSTRCIVTTDLHITGRVAQFGRGILGDVSKKLMAQFASNLNTMLDDQGADTTPCRATATRRRRPVPPTRSTAAASCRSPSSSASHRPASRRRRAVRPAAAGAQDRGPGHRAGRSRRRGRAGDPQAPRPAARRPRHRPVPAPATPLRTERRSRRCPSPRTWTPTTVTASPSCSAAGRPVATTSSCATPAGSPVVIRNAPLLDDGTPMPTRYWLVGRAEVAAVSRLEAAGGVRAAEAAVDAGELAAAHARYAAERDADVPADAVHRPSGGVGGTRQGVKCLHAHYAWHLAGGDDPVGRWVAAQLRRHADRRHRRDDHRPPRRRRVAPCRRRSAELLDELGGRRPSVAAGADQRHRRRHRRCRQPAPRAARRRRAGALELAGDEAVAPRRRRARHPARRGRSTASRLGRDDLEDLFRTLATERRRDRLHNPALQPDRVDSILATCCAVLAIMRRLQFGTTCRRPPADHRALITDAPPIRTSDDPVAAAPLRQPGDAAAARRPGLRRLARGPPAQRGVADAVGATAPAPPVRPHRQPRGLRVALRGPRARRRRRPVVRLRLVRRRPPLRRGQRQPRPARRPADRHDRLLDRRALRRAWPRRRRCRRRLRVRLRATVAAPAGDQHRAAQRQQPAGDGEARHPHARASPCACSRSTACGRTTCATRSPPRSGRSAPTNCAGAGSSPIRASRADERHGRAGSSGSLGEAERLRPCAWRIFVRRFHIFSFQWRRPRERLSSLLRATSGSRWCSGFQAAPGSCTSAGSTPALTCEATLDSSTWMRCRSPCACARSSCLAGTGSSASR